MDEQVDGQGSGLAALLAAVVWIALLVTTDFSPVTLAAGPLAVVCEVGSPTDRRQ